MWELEVLLISKPFAFGYRTLGLAGVLQMAVSVSVSGLIHMTSDSHKIEKERSDNSYSKSQKEEDVINKGGEIMA